MLSKEKKEIRDRITSINHRLGELEKALETEKRGFTDPEKGEFTELVQEKQLLQLKFERSEHTPPDETQTTREMAFESIVDGIKNKSVPDEYRKYVDKDNAIILRDVQNTSTVDPITPMTIGDIVGPLEKGLIMGKVGIRIQTGMDGAWQFPIVAGVEATVVGEDVEISDSTVKIDKIVPNMKRVSISIPVTYQAQNKSAGKLFSIVVEQIQKSLERTLNKWMFSTSALSGTNGGCFTNPATKLTFKDSITWKDAIRLKGQVMKTGVVLDNTMAYVCSAATYADLESTPRDAGSGLMVIENEKINGIPVFITEYIGDDTLGFGVFNYQLVGMSGNTRLIVDPYSQAKKDRIIFTLNTDVDMLSLRPEAFGVLTKEAAPSKDK